MAQGDLLFYYRKPDTWDKLISWWTGSPFYHVAIDDGLGYKYEAMSSGVQRNKLVEDGSFVRWLYADHATDIDMKDMVKAMTFLRQSEGYHYGWSDIATAVNPFRKFWYIVSPEHYDCSALAVQFLVFAGGVDLGPLAYDVHAVTPAMLAKFLGVAV